MIVRKASKEDMPYVARVAWRLALDYPGMENDHFFVAEERGKIIGILGLKDHGEFVEVLSVGVLEEYQGTGLGKRLVDEALKSIKKRIVYLLTVIPGFYEQFGFRKIEQYPETLKKDAAWCAGCDKRKCTAMVRFPLEE